MKTLLYCTFFLLFVIIAGQVYSISKNIKGNIPFVPPNRNDFGVFAGIVNLRASLIIHYLASRLPIITTHFFFLWKILRGINTVLAL